MSIEFVTEIPDAEECRAVVVSALKNDSRYQLLSSSDSASVLLRLTTNAPRENWPEDVVLQFGEDKLGVVFHSASREDRESLLRLLEDALSGLGVSARFVEE